MILFLAWPKLFSPSLRKWWRVRMLCEKRVGRKTTIKTLFINLKNLFLSVPPSDRLSDLLPIYLHCIRPSLRPTVCPSAYLSVRLFVCLSVCPSVWLYLFLSSHDLKHSFNNLFIKCFYGFYFKDLQIAISSSRYNNNYQILPTVKNLEALYDTIYS